MGLRASIISLGAGVAAVATLAGVSAVAIRDALPDDRTTKAAVTKAADARSSERAAAASKQDKVWGVAWSPKMVRDRVTWVFKAGDTPTTDLTVVNATPGADLADTARKCAATVKAGNAAQCYVFASTEAYDFKNITATIKTDTPTAIVNLCWTVLARREPTGPITISDMRPAPQTWDAQDCPASWKGTA